MNTTLQKKCDLLVENTDYIRKNFKLEYEVLRDVSALSLTLNGINAEQSEFKKAASVIKDRTGFFSDFTNFLRLPLAARMVTQKEPLKYLEEIIRVYKNIKGTVFYGSQRMITAMVLAEYEQGARLDNYIDRTNELYAKIKKAHTAQTSPQMLPLIAFLTISSNNPDSTVEILEKNYDNLCDYFGKKKSTYSLAAIVSLLNDGFRNSCEQVTDIYKTLKIYNHSIGNSNEKPVIGAFGNYDADVKLIVGDIIDVDEYLSKKKGFSNFRIGAHMRRSLASLIVLMAYEEEFNMSVSLLDEAMNGVSLPINASLYSLIENSVDIAIAATQAACC